MFDGKQREGERKWGKESGERMGKKPKVIFKVEEKRVHSSFQS